MKTLLITLFSLLALSGFGQAILRNGATTNNNIGFFVSPNPNTQAGPYSANVGAQNGDNAHINLNESSGEQFYDSAGTLQMTVNPTGVFGPNIMAKTASLATNANTLSGSAFVNITNWGAKVDGVVYNNCYATNGNTLYDPLGRFTSSMNGLYCWMRRAGTNGVQDYTIGISNVFSANIIQLSNAPPYFTTNLPVCIGHDDSAAWQNAFNYYGELMAGVKFFIPLNPSTSNTYGISMICDQYQDTGDWRAHRNAQIYAPTIAASGNSPCPVWTFEGAMPATGDSLNGGNGSWFPQGSILMFDGMIGNNNTNLCSHIYLSAQGGSMTGPGNTLREFSVNYLGVVFRDITIMGSYNDNSALINAGVVRINADSSLFSSGGFSVTDTGVVPLETATNSMAICAGLEQEPGNLFSRCNFQYFYKDVEGLPGNYNFLCCNFYDSVVSFDLFNGGGQFITFCGLNNIAPMGVVFNHPGISTTIEADGLNCQTTGSFTNWTLVNDPSGVLSGNIRLLNQNTGPITTNQGVCICNPINLHIDMAMSSNPTGSPYLQSGSFAVGGNVNGGPPQENNPKIFPFLFYNYSRGVQDSPSYFMNVYVAGANNTALVLGGQSFGSGANGVQNIQFLTAPNDSSAATYRGEVDNSGNLDWTGGNATGFGTIQANTAVQGGNFQSYGTHTPGQVTVGASAFTFVNPHQFNLECYTSDSAAYTVAKNGVTISASVVGDGHWILQTNCTLTLTYLSTAPTLYTNAW